MSTVVNIGVIVRNEEGDTFPISLNSQMVKVIQNLLIQTPTSGSSTETGLVDPSGKKLASKESIPIIPRVLEFDWDFAYAPLPRTEEMSLLKGLVEKYAAMKKAAEEADNETEKPRPDHVKSSNPFNMELRATGTASIDDEASKKTNVELVQGAKYPDPIEKQEGVPETEKQDITVIPPPLPLFGESEKPGG